MPYLSDNPVDAIEVYSSDFGSDKVTSNIQISDFIYRAQANIANIAGVMQFSLLGNIENDPDTIVEKHKREIICATNALRVLDGTLLGIVVDDDEILQSRLETFKGNLISFLIYLNAQNMKFLGFELSSKYVPGRNTDELLELTNKHILEQRTTITHLLHYGFLSDSSKFLGEGLEKGVNGPEIKLAIEDVGRIEEAIGLIDNSSLESAEIGIFNVYKILTEYVGISVEFGKLFENNESEKPLDMEGRSKIRDKFTYLLIASKIVYKGIAKFIKKNPELFNVIQPMNQEGLTLPDDNLLAFCLRYEVFLTNAVEKYGASRSKYCNMDESSLLGELRSFYCSILEISGSLSLWKV